MDNSEKVDLLKSLADSVRLSIIQKLAKDEKEVECSAIVKSCALFLNLSQPTMSHHFTRLVQAKVLLERKIGTRKLYSLNRTLLQKHGINPEKL